MKCLQVKHARKVSRFALLFMSVFSLWLTGEEGLFGIRSAGGVAWAAKNHAVFVADAAMRALVVGAVLADFAVQLGFDFFP